MFTLDTDHIVYIITQMPEYSICFLLVSLLILIRLRKKKHKNLKRRKYKKIRKGFYNTGYKCSFSLKDIIKFKLRLADYCDKYGIRYNYLIAIKFFNFEICRMKYVDQKGQVFKRKIKFGS